MVHARVVRPPNHQAKLVRLEDEAIENDAGIIKTVVNGNFMAVIAEREYQAVKAARYLKSIANGSHRKYFLKWKNCMIIFVKSLKHLKTFTMREM